MTAEALRYRWSPADFLRADEAGAFTGRVELVDGEVWPVVLGSWHGETTFRCAHLLTTAGIVVTGETLATGSSLPDPDCWVRRAGARPTGRVSPRLERWDPDDVLLVVEVSDETVAADLGVKARLYGSAGYPVYWVLTRDHVHVHTDPDADGYRTVVRHPRGDTVPVRHTGAAIAVEDLVGPPPAPEG